MTFAARHESTMSGWYYFCSWQGNTSRGIRDKNDFGFVNRFRGHVWGTGSGSWLQTSNNKKKKSSNAQVDVGDF